MRTRDLSTVRVRAGQNQEIYHNWYLVKYNMPVRMVSLSKDGNKIWNGESAHKSAHAMTLAIIITPWVQYKQGVMGGSTVRVTES